MATEQEGVMPLKELQEAIQAGAADEEVLAKASKVLAEDPQDKEALQCKVVALLYCKRFEEALQVTGAELETFELENAYALYRLSRYEEALAALESSADKSREVLSEPLLDSFMEAQLT